METRRIEGKWKIAKGKVREYLGKLFGNEKLRTDGEAERVRGKIEAAAASK